MKLPDWRRHTNVSNEERVSTAETLLDPYDVLGVRRHASLEEIRRGYRDRVKECHPDLGPEKGRAEMFQRVSWAYRHLSEAIVQQQKQQVGREAQDRSTGTDDNSASAGISSTVVDSEIAELLQISRDRLRAGEAEEADTLLRLAIRRAPNDPEIYILLGETMTQRKRFTEAIGCYLMALQINPSSETARDALQTLLNRDVV